MKMNPWKSEKFNSIYFNSDVRTGIALRFEKGVHKDIKLLFINFTKWLRKNYVFPIRVTVYVKERERDRRKFCVKVNKTAPFKQ